MLGINSGFEALIDDRPVEQIQQQIEEQERREKSKIFPLQACEHVFHGKCLRKYFQTQIDNRQFPLKCPEHKCKKDVMSYDIKELLPRDLLDKYYFNTFSLAADAQKDISWCPTADCSFAFVFEEGDTELQCPTCKNHYCLDCRVQFHNGQTCKEY